MFLPLFSCSPLPAWNVKQDRISGSSRSLKTHCPDSLGSTYAYSSELQLARPIYFLKASETAIQNQIRINQMCNRGYTYRVKGNTND